MNWEIEGHEWAVRLLKEHIVKDSLRHAYLLTGPKGIGRRTLALRLAQAINCPNPTAPGEPCLKCSTCARVERMQHPDLAVLKSEVEGGTILVDQVREIQRTLSLSPYEARFRVALLLRFEEANPNAANALLKTLEEPPPQVILLLTAESSESLLATIVSRCEVLRLGPLPLDRTAKALQERWKVPSEQANLLAHLSGGRVGYALRLLNQPDALDNRQAWLEDLRRMLAASRVERFAYADELTKKKETAKEKTREILLVWLSFWRDIMLRSAGANTSLTNLDWAGEADNLAGRLTLDTARQSIAAIERTLEMMDRNVNTRLALEVLLLDLPNLSAN